MVDKRSGTLIDELFGATYNSKSIFNPFLEDPRGGDRVAMQMRTALMGSRRYFLNEDVIQAATALGVQHPDILLAILSRARLPFPKMWIEWDQTVVLRDQGIPRDNDEMNQCGVLLEQISADGEPPVYRLTEMSVDRERGQSHGTVNATSVIYTLDRPILDHLTWLYQERSDLARLGNISKEVMDLCLLGSAYRNLATNGDDEAPESVSQAIAHRRDLCRNLASFASHTFSPFWPNYRQITHSNPRLYDLYAQLVANSIVEFSGTWRFVISVLALLQARDYTTIVQPPSVGRNRFVGNKVVPYLQHHRVSLALPRPIILRKIISSTRDSLPKARHEVEGHWKSHRGDPKCDHVDVSETPNRYRCALCHRARYWMPNHMRGSSLIGFVSKDRVVQKRN